MISRQPTLKEIAQELNISVSTVSRALQNHSSIGLRTRERVHALAEKKQYLPNIAAIGLRKQRKHLVGLVVPTVNPVYVADWVNEATQSLFERGYLAVICQWECAATQSQSVIRALLSQRVDGVLLYGSAERVLHMMSELEGKAMPFVCVDQPIDWLPASASGQQATEALLAMVEG